MMVGTIIPLSIIVPFQWEISVGHYGYSLYTFQGIITHYGSSYQPTAVGCPRPSSQGALGTACGSIHGGACKPESLGKNTADPESGATAQYLL